MSYGNYPIDDNKKTFSSGIYYKGVTSLLNPNLITEDIHHAHYESDKTILTPWDSFSPPKMDKSEAYSWCKAPRLDGKAIEVGSLARQVISKQPLIKDLMEKYGSNVHTRIVARVVELVVIVGYVEKWLDEGFNKEVNFCEPSLKTTSSKGIGLIEAARGGLGHWIEVENEKIINFQVIAPTTWNFSPKDSKGTVGALEQALVGAKKLKNELEPVSVQHIVRSFDPCMVCTVH